MGSARFCRRVGWGVPGFVGEWGGVPGFVGDWGGECQVL